MTDKLLEKIYLQNRPIFEKFSVRVADRKIVNLYCCSTHWRNVALLAYMILKKNALVYVIILIRVSIFIKLCVSYPEAIATYGAFVLCQRQ